MKRVAALTGALIVSLIANVYLLVGRSADGDARVTASSAPAAVHSERRGQASQMIPRAAPVDRAAPAREAALTAQLLTTQAELEAQRLPAFRDHPDRSPEVEAKAKAALDRVYASLPDPKPLYAVECHGATCAITFDDGQDPAVWMKALQGTEIAELDSVELNTTGAVVHVASPVPPDGGAP